MTELHGDSITARPSFHVASEERLADVAHSLTDSFAHRPDNWGQDLAKTDAALRVQGTLPGLNIVDTAYKGNEQPSDLAEAHKIEQMITTGDANSLQQELQNRSPQELREALRIAHDDLAHSGINLTTDWKWGKPVVYVEADGGKTSVEFNDPLSIGHRPLTGTRDGGSRSFHQGSGATAEELDANGGLNRVVTEAMFASWRKQDEELARQGHSDWHVKSFQI